MEIIPVIPRGYCKGVVNAINLAKKCRVDYPKLPITVIGMIVHNQYVVKALEQLNIKTLESKGISRLELLDQVDEGVVLFTAHGIGDAVIEKAKKKGLICVNASCTDVISTKNKVKEKLAEGYEVLYIGQRNHPEAEAVLMCSDHVHLIDSPQSIQSINLTSNMIYVTNQTTMSIFEIKDWIEMIKEKYPMALVEEEICNATRMRQEALLKLTDIDLLYVVGDPVSNNSNKLKSIALSCNIQHVELIEDCHKIKKQDLVGKNRIAVTSGASTPTYLTQQVLDVLEHYSKTQQFIVPEIDLSKII